MARPKPDSKGTKKNCQRCQELLTMIRACVTCYGIWQSGGMKHWDLQEVRHTRYLLRNHRANLAHHIINAHEKEPGDKCLYALERLNITA